MAQFRYLVLLVAGAALLGATPALPDEKVDYNTANWQKEIDGGFMPYHKLKFEDFSPRSVQDRYDAYTQSFIHYNFSNRWRSSGGTATATVTEFDVRSGFDTSHSWRKVTISRGENQLLQHEQGHLDINELGARSLRKIKLSDLPTGTGRTGDEAMQDVERKIKQMVNDTLHQSALRQEQYDTETTHGANADRQAEWTARLKKELAS